MCHRLLGKVVFTKQLQLLKEKAGAIRSKVFAMVYRSTKRKKGRRNGGREGSQIRQYLSYKTRNVFLCLFFFLYFSDTVIVYLSVLCVVSSLFSTNCICQSLNVLFVLESSLMYSYSCFYFAHRQYIQFICSLVSGKAICCQSCDFSSHLRVRLNVRYSDMISLHVSK